MRRIRSIPVLCLLFAPALPGAGVSLREITLGLEASETACSISHPVSNVETTARQVFARVLVQRISAGESLRIDWLDPAGAVAASAPYENLPPSGSLCLLSQLPVAGFQAAQQPGVWQVRVASSSGVMGEKSFELVRPASTSSLAILSVDRHVLGSGETELSVVAMGFSSETSINLAQYTRADGWKYLAHLLPASIDGNRIQVRVPALPPAEYLVILRNSDGSISEPARFVIETPVAYRLPYPAGEKSLDGLRVE